MALPPSQNDVALNFWLACSGSSGALAPTNQTSSRDEFRVLDLLALRKSLPPGEEEEKKGRREKGKKEGEYKNRKNEREH